MNVMRFRIYTDPADATAPAASYVTHDLVILPADRMRAERESTTLLPPSQRGGNARKEHAETWILLWLWCSAVRHQITTESFKDWQLTVLDYDRLDADGNVVTRDAQEVDDPAVDPTQPGAPTT